MCLRPDCRPDCRRRAHQRDQRQRQRRRRRPSCGRHHHTACSCEHRHCGSPPSGIAADIGTAVVPLTVNMLLLVLSDITVMDIVSQLEYNRSRDRFNIRAVSFSRIFMSRIFLFRIFISRIFMSRIFSVPFDFRCKANGTGTNSKVVRHMSGSKRRKNIFCCAVHFFGCTCTFSRLGERFRGGRCSLASFLFVPRCPVSSHL